MIASNIPHHLVKMAKATACLDSASSQRGTIYLLQLQPRPLNTMKILGGNLLSQKGQPKSKATITTPLEGQSVTSGVLNLRRALLRGDMREVDIVA